MGEEEKIAQIAFHFAKIMEALGLDLQDKNLKHTPRRVAKMYVNELFIGLDDAKKPAIKLFDSPSNYHEMVIEKDITFFSLCEHHFVPIFGKVHVGYVPSGKIIGLSKINRLVNYCARRPQVQERLTMDIRQALQEALGIPDVAVMLDGMHFCIAARGVADTGSRTVTRSFDGVFSKKSMQDSFYHHLAFTKYI